MTPINIDALDPDWIKEMSWDLPTDWEGLVAIIGASTSDVKSFLRSPAAVPMPKALKLRAIAYVRGA